MVGEDGAARLATMRAQDGRDIWLFGGGALFGSLASAGLVDTVELAVMPVMLGAGQLVLSGTNARVGLRLSACEPSPGGVISLKYDVDAPLESSR